MSAAEDYVVWEEKLRQTSLHVEYLPVEIFEHRTLMMIISHECQEKLSKIELSTHQSDTPNKNLDHIACFSGLLSFCFFLFWRCPCQEFLICCGESWRRETICSRWIVKFKESERARKRCLFLFSIYCVCFGLHQSNPPSPRRDHVSFPTRPPINAPPLCLSQFNLFRSFYYNTNSKHGLLWLTLSISFTKMFRKNWHFTTFEMG